MANSLEVCVVEMSNPQLVDGEDRKRKRDLEENDVVDDDDDDDDMSEFFPSPTNTLAPLLATGKWMLRKHKAADEEEEQSREWKAKQRDPDWDTPIYPPHIVAPKLQKGMQVNVNSLFSNGGNLGDSTTTSLVRVYQDAPPVPVPVEETLFGKYVLVCCVLVPLWSKASHECRTIINTYSDLKSDGVDIELVVVSKMRKGCERSESAFNHFLSGFPGGCLAIPFSGCSDCRDYVAKSLDFDVYDNTLVCLVLDPNHRVLHLGDTYNFEEQGAAYFPFTEERLKENWNKVPNMSTRLNSLQAFIQEQLSDQAHRNPVTLHELLQCSPSFRLKQAGDAFETDASVPVSYFNDRTVGVYLCHNGRFMDELIEVYRCCVAQGKVFEIVVVCQAFNDDPNLFMNDVNLALKQRGISSWWVYSFNDKVGRCLGQLHHLEFIDKLIVLDPAHQSSDLEARALISNHNVGISAYPFTRECFLKKLFHFFRSLSLESLLSNVKQLLRVDGCVVPTAELKDKKVLLYFGKFVSSKEQPQNFRQLLKWSDEILLRYPNSVVVFIPLNKGELKHLVPPSVVTGLPWLIFPSPCVIELLYSLRVVFDRDVNSCDTLCLTNQLFPKHLDKSKYAHDNIFAFDEHGHIMSRRAQRHLGDPDGKGIGELFDDVLPREIFRGLDIIGFSDL